MHQLNRGIHIWDSHTFKTLFSNSATVATNTVVANLTDITAGNGYSAGGPTMDTVTLTETTGTAQVSIADEVVTASGGSIGPFRYINYYNDTATSDPLCFWYDYASALTLLDGETFTLDHGSTIWTLV